MSRTLFSLGIHRLELELEQVFGKEMRQTPLKGGGRSPSPGDQGLGFRAKG